MEPRQCSSPACEGNFFAKCSCNLRMKYCGNCFRNHEEIHKRSNTRYCKLTKENDTIETSYLIAIHHDKFVDKIIDTISQYSNKATEIQQICNKMNLELRKNAEFTKRCIEYKKEENFHQERNEDVRRVCNYNIYQIQEYFEGEMAKLSLLLENNVIIPGLNNQKDINSSKKEVEELKKEVNYINEIAKGLEDENKLLKSSLRTKDNEIATY